jgi:hypothetical protein
MILRWRDSGDLGGEPGYAPADRPTRLEYEARLRRPGPYTRAEIHDARRPTDRHAWPMPMGCGDEPGHTREGDEMSHLFAQADSARLPLPDASVDLVVGSPPYADARLYLEDGRDLGISRDQFAWVDWMLGVTAEALRVTRGAVIWVCAGVTRDRNYWPCCEGLLWEAHKRGWLSERPVYWHRVGIPGSGGDQWFRADVEYCLAFKRAEKLPWSDNTACGHPPKWAPGGDMSHRLSDGTRRNEWGGTDSPVGERGKDGSRKARSMSRKAAVEAGLGRAIRCRDSSRWSKTDEPKSFNYVPPVKANPGTLLRTTVGGNQLGHPLAHENEAPYPEGVPEFFIKSLCPPDGFVLDPFSGSGTTVSVAARLGRRGVGFDLRRSQCGLGRRRLERPHAPVTKSHAADKPLPLFGGS